MSWTSLNSCPDLFEQIVPTVSTEEFVPTCGFCKTCRSRGWWSHEPSVTCNQNSRLWQAGKPYQRACIKKHSSRMSNWLWYYCTGMMLFIDYILYRFLQCCNMFTLEVGPCSPSCSIPSNFGDVVVTVIAYAVQGMQTVWNLNALCMPCTDSEWLTSYDKIDSIKTMHKNQLCTKYDHCMFPIAIAAGHA